MFKAQWKVDHAFGRLGLGLLMSRYCSWNREALGTRIVATAFRVSARDGTRSRDSRRAEAGTDAPGNSPSLVWNSDRRSVRLGHREVGLDHPVELSTY